MRSSSQSVLLSLALAAAIAIAPPAKAVEPDEILSDPGLEGRARELSTQLRCVVCQSQSIDESNAPLAKDMRIIVRERLTAGDSDEDVLQYMVARYGDYVLLKPPVQNNTLFLWLAPLGIFIFAAGGAGLYLVDMKRARKRMAQAKANAAAAGESDGAAAA